MSKHKIRFEEAREILFDRELIDQDASVEEERRLAVIGMTSKYRVLYVVTIAQEESWIRIISAREASSKERKTYENGS